MKRLNNRNKEIHLLVLFGLLASLFISVNLVINYVPQGNYTFDDELPKSSAISINIVSPSTNENFSTAAPDFVVEISDAVNPIDTMWYTLNGGTNIFFTVNGTIDQNNWTVLPDGPVTITFNANNSISEVDFASVTINKDTSVPILVVVLPVNNAVVMIRPPIQVIVYEVNIDSIWFRVNSYNFELTNNSAQPLDQLVWAALPEGEFIIELFANDTAGNLNDYFTITLTKDISAPIVDIVHPLPDARYGASAPQITLTINDATLDNTWYSIVGTNFTFQFTPTLGTNVITINQVAWNSLSEGNVTIIFYANDSLGRTSFDSIRLVKDLPEEFDLIAFLLSPLGLTIIGTAIAIVIIVILLKRRKTHRTSEKEVRKIESLWD